MREKLWALKIPVPQYQNALPAHPSPACPAHMPHPPVSRLDGVDEVVVCVEDDGVGGLPRGHVVGRLLQLHHLLVGEEGEIVDERHAVQRLAVRADSRLRDPAAVNLDRLGLLTDVATEERWRGEREGREGKGRKYML